MLRALTAIFIMLLPLIPALAEVPPYPPGFRTREIATNGATIHVRVGG